VVPLFALIQSRTRGAVARDRRHEHPERGFIVPRRSAGSALQRGLGWTIPQVLLALAIANAVVALYIFTIVPEFAMRFVSWLLVRTLYRLRLHGIEKHVPDEGPALLVCNHVSYMDALILAARSRGRCASSCTTRSSTSR
jgi:hypothetical protein